MLLQHTAYSFKGPQFVGNEKIVYMYVQLVNLV